MSKTLAAFILTVLALAACAALVALHDLPVDVLTGVIGVAIGGGGAVGAQQIGGGSTAPPTSTTTAPPSPTGRQSVFPS